MTATRVGEGGRDVSAEQQIADNVDAVVWLAEADHSRFHYVSASYERVWGGSRDALLASASAWFSFVHDDDRARVRAAFERGATEWSDEHRIVRSDGSVRWIEARVTPVRGDGGGPRRVVGVAEDVTARVLADRAHRDESERLEASLRETTVLLREVHHRVKNNLQLISSLLYLHAEELDEEHAGVLAQCRDRVLAMSLVHEALAVSSDRAQVEPGQYLRPLVDAVRATWGASAAVDVAWDLEAGPLDAQTAIPCGLIVNELLTNAFKHAFPRGRPGVVRVALRPRGGSTELVVSDDGVGIPEHVDLERPQSLGMRLLRSLTEQLGGSLEIARAGGTRIRVLFPTGAREPSSWTGP